MNLCIKHTLSAKVVFVCGRFVLQLLQGCHMCCICQIKSSSSFCYYVSFFCQAMCPFFILRCIMVFINLRVCFFGSVEHIKSRSDLRDQFRSTLVGFGKSWSFGHKIGAKVRETALTITAFVCLQLTYLKYAANVICLFVKMEHLVYLPLLIFWAGTWQYLLQTTGLFCNHSLGFSYQTMSQFWYTTC